MIDSTKAKALLARYKASNDESTKRKILIEIINLVAQDFMPEARMAVASIKSKPATTSHHYGDYMMFLSAIPKGLHRLALAKAMVMAGGDAEGIKSALKVM